MTSLSSHWLFQSVPKNENELRLPGRKIRLLNKKHGVAWVDHLLMVRLSDLSQPLNFRGFEMPSNDSTHSTQRCICLNRLLNYINGKPSLIVWNDRDKSFSAKKRGKEKRTEKLVAVKGHILLKQVKSTCTCQWKTRGRNEQRKRIEEEEQGERKRRGGIRDAVKVKEGLREDQEQLDAVKRLAVVCIAVALRRTALLAGRSCSHVRARERLQLVQLLRQFAQHTGAEVGAALG